MLKCTSDQFIHIVDHISVQYKEASIPGAKKQTPLPVKLEEGFLLPDLDSNQDKQSQSLSYYRYTIRQFRIKSIFPLFSAAKIT